jgi:hypothetical protein
MDEQYNIHIVAYESKSIFGKLIRYWTRHEFSHVEVMRQNPEKDSLTSTIGALELKGVVWSDINEKKGKYEIFEITLTKEEYKLFWQYIYANLGKGYDYLGILGFVFTKFKENPNRFYCSELIYKALLHAKVNYWNEPQKYMPPGVLVSVAQIRSVKKGEN